MYRCTTTVGGSTNWQYISQVQSIAEYSNAGTTCSGTLINTVLIGPSATTTINLEVLRIRVVPFAILRFTCEITSGTASDCDVGMSWTERQ